jgi:LysM repeat protein
MAHEYGRQGNRTRSRIYVILAVLIIAAVVTYVYKYHPIGRGKAAATVTSTNTGGLTTLPAAKPETKSSFSKFAQSTAKDSPQVAELITEAASYINSKPPRIIDARDRLNETLPMPMSEQQRELIKKQLSDLADKWLFSRTIFPQDKLTSSYKVKPGDVLAGISKQYKVPHEILMEINKMSRPESLQAGDTLKVINGPFNVRVYRSTFTMDLYLQNTFVRSFPVGLGKDSMETPTGLWVVKKDGKMIAPTWTDPVSGKTYESEAPDYPLGSRWIGLEGIEGEAVGRSGFAIHGTKDPNGIGMASSQGCIRLRDGNAIFIYKLLVPKDSRVEVME